VNPPGGVGSLSLIIIIPFTKKFRSRNIFTLCALMLLQSKNHKY
jgi:hypothetical protein